MGDRSNIVVKDSDGSRIWLYGHWMGADSIRVVAEVLELRTRWSDAPYLTRLLFSHMTAGEPPFAETGFGISTRMCDNEYPVIVLDTFTGTVVLEDAPFGQELTEVTPAVTFDEFLSVVPDGTPDFETLAVKMGAKPVVGV